MVSLELPGDRYKTPLSCVWGCLWTPMLAMENNCKKHSRDDPITSKPVRPQGDKGIAWRGTRVSQADKTLYTACELWCNTYTTEVGWEDGLKTTVFHSQLVYGAEGAEAELSTRADLSCWICGNTSKLEEKEGLVGIV